MLGRGGGRLLSPPPPHEGGQASLPLQPGERGSRQREDSGGLTGQPVQSGAGEKSGRLARDPPTLRIPPSPGPRQAASQSRVALQGGPLPLPSGPLRAPLGGGAVRRTDLDGAGVLGVVQQADGAAALALQAPAAAAHQPAQHLGRPLAPRPARLPSHGGRRRGLRLPGFHTPACLPARLLPVRLLAGSLGGPAGCTKRRAQRGRPWMRQGPAEPIPAPRPL